MFKVGDKVRVTNSRIVSLGMEGTVVRVLSSSLPIVFEVKLDKYASTTIYFYAAELELVSSLPVGSQMPLGSASLLMDDSLDTPSLYGAYENTPDYKRNDPKCDCGGFKVYGVLSAEAHSPWCSIFTKKS